MEGRYARSPFFALVRYELRSLALLGIVFVLMYGGLLLLLPFLAPPIQGLAVAWIALPLPLWLSAASLPSEERRSVRSSTLGALPVDPRTRWWAKLLVLAAVGSSHFALCFALVWFPAIEYSEQAVPGPLQEYVVRTWFWFGLPAGFAVFALSSATGRQVPSVVFGLLGAIVDLVLWLSITAESQDGAAAPVFAIFLSSSVFCVLSRVAFLWRFDPHFEAAAIVESIYGRSLGFALSLLKPSATSYNSINQSLRKVPSEKEKPPRVDRSLACRVASPFMALLCYELRSLAMMIIALIALLAGSVALLCSLPRDYQNLVAWALSAPLPMWLSAAALFADEYRSGRNSTFHRLPVDPRTRWCAKLTAMMSIACTQFAVVMVIACAYDVLVPNLRDPFSNFQSVALGWLWFGAPTGFAIFAISPVMRQPMIALALGLLAGGVDTAIRSAAMLGSTNPKLKAATLFAISACLLLAVSRTAFLLREDPHNSLSGFLLRVRKLRIGLPLSCFALAGLAACSREKVTPGVEDILFEENNDCGYAIQLREEELERNARGEVREGRREGVWQFRHSNGRVAHQGSYSRGEKEGAWCRWSDDGILAERTYYSRGAREGPSIHFDHCGREIARGAYRADRLLGRWTVQPPDYWGIPGSYVVEYDLQGRRVQ